MAASLKIIDNITLTDAVGQNSTISQGAIGSASGTPFDFANAVLTTVFGTPAALAGLKYFDNGTLATVTALKIYDSAVHVPATFNYLKFWADQPLYIQFITAATNVVLQVVPLVPFCLSVDGLLAAAATTPITGTTPVIAAIAKIYIQNPTAVTANWQIGLIL